MYNICNLIHIIFIVLTGYPGSSAGKESTWTAGDLGSIPALGRSPGEGNGNPLQYSGLENPHGQRSLAGYSPQGHRAGHDWVTISTGHTHTEKLFFPKQEQTESLGETYAVLAYLKDVKDEQKEEWKKNFTLKRIKN